jgi:hypothetical protein
MEIVVFADRCVSGPSGMFCADFSRVRTSQSGISKKERCTMCFHFVGKVAVARFSSGQISNRTRQLTPKDLARQHAI